MMNILILEDEASISKGIQVFLQHDGYKAETAHAPSEARKLLEKQKFDVLISDLKLPEMDGTDFIKEVAPQYPDLEFIMISGHAEMPDVIEAMRLGVIDFIPKPFSLRDISISLRRTQNFIRLNQKLRSSESKTRKLIERESGQVENRLVYQSESMQQIVKLVELIANVEEVPVLITGESGTGKELIARRIYQSSTRQKHPFITANCAAIPFDLFESEFFGHTKGAFTGAVSDQPGLFELADKGFLFLDEIGELDLRLQSKLLRAIENLEIKRVGGKGHTKVNTRLIAATNQQLIDLVKQGKFRNDLFHRLSVFIIHIPPLRERRDDVLPLFNHFLNRAATKTRKPVPACSKELKKALMSYAFPGNVRELKNMTERAMIIGNEDMLTLDHFHFPFLKKGSQFTETNTLTADQFDLKNAERQMIERALEHANGNKSKAARLLKITPQSLRRRMEKYNLV
jgi:DNA-binding NtrC family response regulator